MKAYFTKRQEDIIISLKLSEQYIKFNEDGSMFSYHDIPVIITENLDKGMTIEMKQDEYDVLSEWNHIRYEPMTHINIYHNLKVVIEKIIK